MIIMVLIFFAVNAAHCLIMHISVLIIVHMVLINPHVKIALYIAMPKRNAKK